ncbi:TetR/AcrR family transcriptional regulator [Nocardioides daeguensis]|uniref:TetR/AcrR family transcriptional regulator n=1 Tax=Nocardioides daeguensis TaxID=908359 RepID=A0ABP6WH31_9ACTN|nr:TetR/AcrR family transcriptional regulator [Nocardioides daeguensis]MBV6728011.1 TetR/AcrR family transcriptional regulator [Nocardioides daeguensis]MCR1774085.1 TetR/AcrR family transcriptional regulator [Nocardioides daeguensis]
MPRITGASIAEHVAAQEAAVVAAAQRLFAERGVAAVSLGDIAAEVGLRRTSLYRYFPTKGHILQVWFDREMDPLLARSQEVVDELGPTVEALRAWLDVQLDFVADEAHGALVDASAGASDLSPEILEHFGQRHRELYATLGGILRTGGARTPEEVRVRALLVAGLVRSSADLVAGGVPTAVVREELHRAATAVAGLD